MQEEIFVPHKYLNPCPWNRKPVCYQWAMLTSSIIDFLFCFDLKNDVQDSNADLIWVLLNFHKNNESERQIWKYFSLGPKSRN